MFSPLPLPTQLLTLLTLLTLFTLPTASYIIDDSNITALEYIVSPSAKAKWGPFGSDSGEELTLFFNGVTLLVNDSLAYNDTFTYGACHATDGCSVTVPFTGSGATIYAMQAGGQGINISVTVDGGPPKTAVLPPIPGPSYEKGNNSLFSVQSLNSSAHSLTMTVVDWNGTFSGMMLDYINVNETHADPAAIQSATATATTTVSASGTESRSAVPIASQTSNSASHSKTHSAVIGGVVGSLAALAALALLFFCIRRQKSNTQRRDQTHISQPFEYKLNHAPTTAYPDIPLENGGVSPFPVEISPSSTTKLTSSPSHQSLPSRSSLYPTTASSSTPLDNRTSAGRSKLAAEAARSRTQAPVSLSPPAATSSATTERERERERDIQLTDEQVDFVNNLHRRNIPASAIARIMEGMLSGGGVEEPESGVGVLLSVGADETAPPSYEAHRT